MLNYPDIDPVALQIGPAAIHWYGIMYLIGFAGAWLGGIYQAKKAYSPFKPNQIADAVFYGAIGVILGGRLGYVLFYNLNYYVHNPLSIWQIWQGGMSFHGGMLGVLFAAWLFARKNRCHLFDVCDFFAPMVPIGLAAGRIGNFINGELWGRVTDSPIAMVFPKAGVLPRYPSQLIEALTEGMLLFIILWLYAGKARPRFAVSGIFAMGYGIFRFVSEFFRQPDPQLGFILFGWMSQGQLLSIPMILIGAILLINAYMTKPRIYAPNKTANHL